MRHSTSKLLRQEDSADTGFILRRCTDISGVGNPSSQVPELWKSEAREDRLDIKQSVLHETFFLLCGTKMPCYDHSRCLQRIKIRLASSQYIRERIYARAASSKSCFSTTDNRDIRNIFEKRTYLQDNCKRLREESSRKCLKNRQRKTSQTRRYYMTSFM